MASGFIIFKDGRCFARRWSVYDELLKMAIKELSQWPEGVALAQWLEHQIPINASEEEGDAGWGFFNERLQVWKNRELDLRSLTPANQALFVKAIRKAWQCLQKDESYADLAPFLVEDFHKMMELAERGENPLDYSDWTELAKACSEQNGPGWED